MKLSLLYIIFLLIIISCNENKSILIHSNASDYNNLILNVVLSNPDLLPPYKVPEHSLDSFSNQILKVSKEVIDNKLGITLRLHKWSYDGQTPPKTIVYISDKKGFQYAFPFLDEYYYYCIYVSSSEDEQLIDEYQWKFMFDWQLNFAIQNLKLNKVSKTGELDKFISLLMDSLLGSSEITLNTISDLNAKLNSAKSRYHETDSCRNKTIISLQKMINNLQNNKDNIRYFSCIDGYDSYWKFKSILKDSIVFVKPSFENKECYFDVYF